MEGAMDVKLGEGVTQVTHSFLSEGTMARKSILSNFLVMNGPSSQGVVLVITSFLTKRTT